MLAGATVFTVNFFFVKDEESERLAHAFYQRLSTFSAGEKLLENVFGNGLGSHECWVLNDEGVEAILTETDGNLFAYNVLYKPKDWLIYAGDQIVLQVVSHEQEVTLRLSEIQYSEFTKLGIPHKQISRDNRSGAVFLKARPQRLPEINYRKIAPRKALDFGGCKSRPETVRSPW